MPDVRTPPILLPSRRLMAAGALSPAGGEAILDRERVNLGLLAVGVLLFMLFAWSFYQDIARQSAMGRPGAVEEFADTRF